MFILPIDNDNSPSFIEPLTYILARGLYTKPNSSLLMWFGPFLDDIGIKSLFPVREALVNATTLIVSRLAKILIIVFYICILTLPNNAI